MADFSYAYNNQTLSPNPAYPFAGLDPVLLTFNRYDVFTWSAGIRRAVGQLLITDSGWIAGTRVAIVFADGSILYDTVATIAEAAGNTNLTFTTYNSEVTGSATITNLDYVGYRIHLRLSGTRLVGATAVPFTVEAYAPFSAAGYASVDVAALVRDRLNTHPEWLTNGTRQMASVGFEGPVEDEVVICDIDYRSECTTYTGTYGWNNSAGDTALCKFYHARESKGPTTYNELPGSPSLYQQSAREYTGVEPLIGGILVERGAVPFWRYGAADLSSTDVVVPIYFTVIWEDPSASNTLVLETSQNGVTVGNYSLTDSGVYHLTGVLIALTTSDTFLIESLGYGASDTFQPLTGKLQYCTCPLIRLVWRNSMGGFSTWAFELTEGQQNIGSRGDLFDSANSDGQGYATTYQNVSNARQGIIGQYRAPAQNEALQITLADGALTGANILYLQSILTSQEVFWMEGDNYLYQMSPVTITGGDAPIRKRANDLYDFTATLNAPLR